MYPILKYLIELPSLLKTQTCTIKLSGHRVSHLHLRAIVHHLLVSTWVAMWNNREGLNDNIFGVVKENDFDVGEDE